MNEIPFTLQVSRKNGCEKGEKTEEFLPVAAIFVDVAGSDDVIIYLRKNVCIVVIDASSAVIA